MSSVDRKTGDSAQRETPDERRRRVSQDPYRGKKTRQFIENGRKKPDGKGATSHQQRAREQKSGSLKRERPRNGSRR